MKKNKIIIISHKNPDTDSIVSSLVVEEYFKNILKIDAKAYRIGELNKETKFVLNQFKIEKPPFIKFLPEDARIILVDHNNPDESINNLKPSQVEEIIDHHKLTLQTEKPIFARFEPLGSTSTILTKMYLEEKKKMPAKVAKLLLAGILSDTLNLTSTTTTKEDRKLTRGLNRIAKINIKEFVQKMFEAKSDIAGLTPLNIIEKDSKLFQMGKNRVIIAAWETLKPDTILKIKEEIISELKNKKTAEGVDYIFFKLVDILKGDSIMFIIGDEEQRLAEKVFGGKTKENLLYLKGIVSRKKQVVPPLMNELTK